MFDSLASESVPSVPSPPVSDFYDKKKESLATHPWIRHYEQGVAIHITIPDQPLTMLLDETSTRYPNYTAIIYYGAKFTYAQLAHYVDRFAAALQRLGVRKGERVAIALPNIPQYPIAFYGALKTGAVVVPTNPLYTENELQHQLVDSGARVMIMLDTYYPLVRAIRHQTALEHVIVTSPADYLPLALRALYPLEQLRSRQPQAHLTQAELQTDQTLQRMDELLASEAQPYIAIPLESGDLAVLQYTGGTTGLAKGAMLTHKAVLANTLQVRDWFAKVREGEEVVLCVAPFFHSYGMTACMNISIRLAATMILLPRFKSKDVVMMIRRYHPTLFPGVPTMYLAVMDEAKKHPEDFHSIKYCISGAAPLPAKVQADFEALTHGKLVEGYGLSEASPVTHCNPLTDECRNGSIGLPLPEVDAAIMNSETGELVPIGEVGELVVKGPNIMRGYWQHEEETRAIFHDGWMCTGDLAKMDGDGYFSIVERIKDVIIASGFKVYPREVEEVLFRHPFVAETGVAAAPDAYRGETVAAFVVLKKGIEASDETRQELIRFCKQELAAYKVPKIIEFRTSLPKSLIGKVLHRELYIKPVV